MNSQHPQLLRVERALTHLLLDEPFYATLALRLKLVQRRVGCPTFQTDGVEIQVNPDFCATLNAKEIGTVLCEEVLHVAMGHLWRAPFGVEWKTWNIACDNEVRWIMSGILDKAGQPVFPMPKDGEPDPQFKGMAAEQIYHAIMSRKHGDKNQQQPQQQPGKNGQQGNGQGQGKSSGQGMQQPAPQNGSGKPQSGGQPSPQGGGQPGTDESAGAGQPGADVPDASEGGLGNFIPPKLSDGESDGLKQEWEMAMLQAARSCKGRGNVPGAILERIEQIVAPKVDWRQLVRDWARRVCKEDWNWTRRNLRYAGTGFILPSLHSERVGPIVIARDTSGSIDENLNAQFLGEAQNFLDELNPEKLVDITCDRKIHTVAEYHQGDTIDRNAPGRGGTDFRPVFEHVNEWDEPPSALVYLTDLDGRFPDIEPDYPVLWVSYNTTSTPPWGDHVNV